MKYRAPFSIFHLVNKGAIIVDLHSRDASSQTISLGGGRLVVTKRVGHLGKKTLCTIEIGNVPPHNTCGIPWILRFCLCLITYRPSSLCMAGLCRPLLLMNGAVVSLFCLMLSRRCL